LKIGFQLAKGRGRSIVLKYGADSLSLPSEISRFVLAARDVTNPWYEEFRSNAQKGTQQASQPSVPEVKSVLTMREEMASAPFRGGRRVVIDLADTRS
jgi:hypothetical protein